MKKLSLLTSVFALTLLFSFSSVQAQEAETIAAEPELISVEADTSVETGLALSEAKEA